MSNGRRDTPVSLLVLGGTSDIALATVRALAAHGLEQVVLAGRSTERLERAAAGLADLNFQNVATELFDATETGAHGEQLRAMRDRHGVFDAVLVAFGVLGEPFTLEEQPGVAADLITANFSGAVSSGLASAQMLAENGGGTIAIISSITAVRPRAGNLIYGSAKAGLDAFARTLHDAVSGTGVRVMTVRPGWVDTAMTDGLEPAPFATTAEAVAADIVAGFQKGSAVVWSPRVLQIVGPILQSLPAPVWRRISAR